MAIFRLWFPVLALVFAATSAISHVSEQGFVLLLPTDIYIAAGAASVALTVVVFSLLPAPVLTGLFTPLALIRVRRGVLRHLTSGLAALFLGWLVWVGLTGARDPLANPLPLFIWTLWWIGFVSLQGLIGNFWAWVNPWTGLLALVDMRALVHLPHRAAPWCAMVQFLGFAGFLLADIAPSDPARLAWFVAAYWLANLGAALVFGRRWIYRAEALSVLMRAYARVAVFGRHRRRLAAGVPGWQVLAMRAPPLGLAVFMVVLLGSGSFDGLNETFWWLARLGVNPLEFPGRSAVVTPTLAGLVAANAALVAVFGLAVRLGLTLGGAGIGTGDAFRAFAPSLLPIALGYHVAHYLTSFLVDAQYALKAASDPLGIGADWLGLGEFYVTTGFFNTRDTVRIIWLGQAGAVVIGHILAIALAHGIALRLFGSTRRAALSQAPLAAFMIAYTFLGLWLLASPRGA